MLENGQSAAGPTVKIEYANEFAHHHRPTAPARATRDRGIELATTLSCVACVNGTERHFRKLPDIRRMAGAVGVASARAGRHAEGALTSPRAGPASPAPAES